MISSGSCLCTPCYCLVGAICGVVLRADVWHDEQLKTVWASVYLTEMHLPLRRRMLFSTALLLRMWLTVGGAPAPAVPHVSSSEGIAAARVVMHRAASHPLGHLHRDRVAVRRTSILSDAANLLVLHSSSGRDLPTLELTCVYEKPHNFSVVLLRPMFCKRKIRRCVMHARTQPSSIPYRRSSRVYFSIAHTPSPSLSPPRCVQKLLRLPHMRI